MPPTPPSVAIVVLNYNGLEDTLKCLDSLRQVHHRRLTVILVDNGSAVDPEEAARARYPELLVVKTGRNLGYAGGNNRGIQLALKNGADYVLVLNNDTTVAPTLVGDLLDAFAMDPALGIVGPVINFMDEPEAVMTDGVRFNPGPGAEFFRRIRVPLESAPVADVDIVNGCCMMMRSGLLRQVGLFDETLFIVHEESDLCLRAIRAGFRCAVLGRTLVWHKGSSSFVRSGREFQRYFDTRNLWYLLKRHAGQIASSRSRRQSVWPYLSYTAYRYETEREAGQTKAAEAVIEGLADAMLGRTGPRSGRRNPFAGVVRAAFAFRRTLARHRKLVPLNVVRG